MELVLVNKILENIFNGGNFAVILPQVRREFLEQVTDSWMKITSYGAAWRAGF